MPYKRIATEEAFGTVEIFDRYKQMLSAGGDLDPGFKSAMGYFLLHPSPRARTIAERLADLDARRIGDMDAAGIDLQLLSLTSPGVQVFDRETATALAVDANDQLAAAIARHPTRFAGLTAIAPQDPARAAREIERGDDDAGPQGRHRELAHAGRVPRRPEVLGRSSRLPRPWTRPSICIPTRRRGR